MYSDARHGIPKSKSETLHRNSKTWQRAIAKIKLKKKYR